MDGSAGDCVAVREPHKRPAEAPRLAGSFWYPLSYLTGAK